MAGFNSTDVAKLTFKVQAGGGIDAASGARWYESKLAFSPKVVPNRIFQWPVRQQQLLLPPPLILPL